MRERALARLRMVESEREWVSCERKRVSKREREKVKE